MRKALFAALFGLTLAGLPAGAADNPVGQAVQRLHLTPQQLLSLRDFLGGFNRGAEVEAAEGGLFVLRDANSMAYGGEFMLRLRADGALEVDRVAGPARLDFSRIVQPPLRLLAKSRALILVTLAGSQMLNPAPRPEGESPAPRSAAPLLLPQIAGLKLTDNGTAVVLQSRAVFFRDGSGSVVSVRTPGSPTAPMRIATRYYSAIRSDGAGVWRDSVVEFDSDLQLRLADLETRYACLVGKLCAASRGLAPSTAFHMVRWQHELIAAVPPTLLAQLTPPQQTPVNPADAPPAPPVAAQRAMPPGDRQPASPENNPRI